MRKQNSFYVLSDYYRENIELDTAKDARHLLSVLTSVFPDIHVEFSDKCIHCLNIRNHMLKKVNITWLNGI